MTITNTAKLRILEKTLIKRIMRGEKADNVIFRTARTYNSDTKDFYGVDLNTSSIMYSFDYCALESWARENNYLKPYEMLATSNQSQVK